MGARSNPADPKYGIVLKKIAELNISPFRTGIEGSSLTTFAIGGQVPVVLEPQNEEQLLSLVSLLLETDVPYRVIGLGSNLVIGDEGIEDWVIRLGAGFRSFKEFSRDTATVLIEAGGGASLMRLSRDTSEKGYAGLGFAGGIPGSIGGGVRMNAGAHGGDLGSVIESVRYLNGDGQIIELNRDTLSFSYRHSNLPLNAIVLSANLRLDLSSKEETQLERRRCLDERKSRQPLTLPSAGSVFRNPAENQTAGYLIESVGLKGFEIGGAKVSEMHANWIVNESGRARAEEVRAIVKRCQEVVLDRYNLSLHPEIIPWGFTFD